MKPEGPAQREQKPRIEDGHCGALSPAPKGIGAHRIRSHAGDSAERKKEPLQPFVASATQQDRRGKNHKNPRRNNVRNRERGVRREDCIEVPYRRTAASGTDQCEEPPDHGGEGDDNANPKPC